MSRPLTAQQLEAFRAVVLSGTTVAAAQMLHTTQPTISRLLGQAQKASGLKLFVNDRGRLQLTREGRHLFEAVQFHYQGLDRIEQAVSALKSSGAGVFRIACTPSLGQSLLPPVLQRFAKAHAQMHFNVQTLGSRQIEEGLRHGMYDIAITNGPFEGSEFQVIEVHRSEAVLIASLDHPFTALPQVRLEDLKDQTLISLPRNDQLEIELRRAFDSRGVVQPTTIETIYSSMICAFAERGLGVGIINPYMASVFKDRLTIRRFSPKINVATFAVFSRFSPSSEKAEELLAELRAFMQAYDWLPPKPVAARRKTATPMPR